MKSEFTKKQLTRIESCQDERIKQNWIEHFRHINEMKKSEDHKAFKKSLKNYY